jgi:adenosylmethionine-8-amino-7-oxononanoate aminotransferase
VLSPPLIIQRDEIDQMFDILESSLDEVAAEML